MYTSIKHLKDNLSEYVHRAQEGEEIIITSHKQPVAKLIPIIKSETKLADKHNQLMIDIGSLLEKQKKSKTKHAMSQFVVKMRQQERY